MFDIRIAELNVRIENRYDLILGKCQSYLTSGCVPPDLTIGMTETEIQTLQANVLKCDGKAISEPEAEYDGTHYRMYPDLYRFQAFWLHACVIAMDGWGYAFSARPGTGKTTHAMEWLKKFPDKARIVNGDNPIIRKKDGIYIAYGTPFPGKEGYNENRSVPLKGLCFLHRAETNRIERMDPAIAMMRLFWDNWCIRRMGEECVQSNLDLYNDFVEQVPIYQFHVNNYLPDTVEVAYRGLQGGR